MEERGGGREGCGEDEKREGGVKVGCSGMR